MTDPRDNAQRHDAGRDTPDVGGRRAEGEPRNDADDVVAVGDEVGPDANELDADNAVEEETIETVDPDNAPA